MIDPVSFGVILSVGCFGGAAVLYLVISYGERNARKEEMERDGVK